MDNQQHHKGEVKRLTKVAWKVTAPKDRVAFVRNLPLIFSRDVRLFVEGCKIPPETRTFLAANQLHDCPVVGLDTTWPIPEVFHLPVTPELMDQLAAFAQVDDRWELCDHLKAYRDDQEIMAWYDADCDDPWGLDDSVTEEDLKKFCSIAGCQYERFEGKE